jgi:hypothetical protein
VVVGAALVVVVGADVVLVPRVVVGADVVDAETSTGAVSPAAPAQAVSSKTEITMIPG